MHTRHEVAITAAVNRRAKGRTVDRARHSSAGEEDTKLIRFLRSFLKLPKAALCTCCGSICSTVCNFKVDKFPSFCALRSLKAGINGTFSSILSGSHC